MPVLQLDDIQGDVLVGLQKNAELFLFFRIIDVPLFKAAMRGQVVRRLTSVRRTLERDRIADRRGVVAPRRRQGRAALGRGRAAGSCRLG